MAKKIIATITALALSLGVMLAEPASELGIQPTAYGPPVEVVVLQ